MNNYHNNKGNKIYFTYSNNGVLKKIHELRINEHLGLVNISKRLNQEGFKNINNELFKPYQIQYLLNHFIVDPLGKYKYKRNRIVQNELDNLPHEDSAYNFTLEAEVDNLPYEEFNNNNVDIRKLMASVGNPQSTSCSICFSPHRNRKDNYCNECRGGKITFGKYIGKSYRHVYVTDKSYINWLILNQEKLIIAKKYNTNRLDNLRIERMEKMYRTNKGILNFINWCKLQESITNN
jgi:hypothetical protein